MPCKSQEAWGPQNADEEFRGAWRHLTTQTGVALLHTAAHPPVDRLSGVFLAPLLATGTGY